MEGVTEECLVVSRFDSLVSPCFFKELYWDMRDYSLLFFDAVCPIDMSARFCVVQPLDTCLHCLKTTVCTIIHVLYSI